MSAQNSTIRNVTSESGVSPAIEVPVFMNFVGGEWKSCRSSQTFVNENPADKGSVLGHFQSSSAEDAKDAVDAAAEAFGSWARASLAERQRPVTEFLRLLAESRNELARVVTLENGKTLREAHAEIDSAILEGTHHLHQVGAFYGHTGPGSLNELTSWVQYEPVGVVGVISPWNFPINVMCRKVLPALLTGNTVVFKPASFTPWSAVLLAQTFERARLPRGVFNCITGAGSSVGNALIEDARVRAVSFTGSTEVGRKIFAKSAAHLTRTQLELGGKNALIVMDDADLDAALDAAMTAGFANAGQWCTSTSRILLHKDIAEGFLSRLVSRCSAITVGNGLSETTDMGPVAGDQQYADIKTAIARGQDEGAHLVAGDRIGPAPEGAGYFIRPTVFAKVTPEMFLFREEIFGPVLAACEFGSLSEAIALANDSIYGLSSSIFTRDLRTAHTYINGIEAGMAHVNIHTGYKEPWMPFGGVKQSGAGLPENSESGLEFFVNRKAVYLRSR